MSHPHLPSPRPPAGRPRDAQFLSVSLPRSGHHYLASLFERLFGDEFRYCEYYTEDGCCRSVPCRLAGGCRVFLQKNHDFDLLLPVDLPGVTYVVQYRNPLFAVLSDREYLARLEGEELARDRDEYLVWLARRVAYYEGFFAKWLQSQEGAPRVTLDYDDLVDRPAQELTRVLETAGVAIAYDRIESAVDGSQEHSASFPVTTRPPRFERRRLEASRYLDPELLPVFESLLLDRLPQLRSRRQLPEVSYTGHPLTHAYLAEVARARGDLATQLSETKEALRGAPRNPYLLAALANNLAGLGRSVDALEAIGDAVSIAPQNPILVRQQSDLLVLRASQIFDNAIQVAERLVAMRPDDPGARVHLARLSLRSGDGVGAHRHASRAIALGSRDPQVWRISSEIFRSCQDWGSAVAAARGAIALEPAVGEFHHHLANMLALAGEIDEAILEHVEAVALGPDEPGWRWRLAEDLRRAGRIEAARETTREALRRFPGEASLLAFAAMLEH